MSGQVVVGLDIGTTKIVCLIAEKTEDGGISILAKGESKSDGLRRGVVVNIEATAKAISEAVKIAESQCDVEIKDVYVGIAGDHISSKASTGMVTISGSNKVVSQDDVKRVIEVAKSISVPSEREILHIIPLEFTIDGQEGILEPIGMNGMQLTADIHIITALKSSMQNIKNSVTKAGLNAIDFVLEPLASSYSILDHDEKGLGVCLIDIGGGTTDIAMYFEGSLRYTAIVPLGGYNVTNDLSLGLRTPYDIAEDIKTKHGVAHTALVYDDESGIEIPGVGGRKPSMISKNIIAQIIQPRMEELFEMVYTEMKKTDYFDLMSAGIVLTGGASMLEGASELANKTIGLPVKIGVPKGVTGLIDSVNEPKYATAVGLVKYAMNKDKVSKGPMHTNDFFTKIKNWLDNIL